MEQQEGKIFWGKWWVYRSIGDEEEGEEQTVEEPERVPLLFVDVNLGQGKTERIVVHEGDESAALAEKFAEEHGNFGFLG